MTMENGACEMKPQTYPSSDDVYMNMCPCGKYLTCGMSGDQEMVMCLSNSESDMSEITYEVVMDWTSLQDKHLSPSQQWRSTI